MAVIHCKACGKSYRYEKEGCCPECGAYNRPPKHERVNPDGTVQHMTDAAYEKRQRSQGSQGKVCFEKKECYEEKVCYEDQARHGRQTGTVRGRTSAAFSRPASASSSGKTKKGKPGVSLLVAAIVLLGSFSGLITSFFERVSEPVSNIIHELPSDDPNVNVVEEPAWADARMGEKLVMMDGSTIAVTSWGGNIHDQINVYLKMDLQDGDHEFYAALICLDQEGRETYLTDFSVEETDRGTCLQFSADGEELEPAYLELEERLEDATLQTLYVDLQS